MAEHNQELEPKGQEYQIEMISWLPPRTSDHPYSVFTKCNRAACDGAMVRSIILRIIQRASEDKEKKEESTSKGEGHDRTRLWERPWEAASARQKFKSFKAGGKILHRNRSGHWNNRIIMRSIDPLLNVQGSVTEGREH